MEKKTIITIGRQFGSGGREVGRLIAQKLSIPCYDKELLDIAARSSGISKELFETADERATSSLLYTLSMDAYSMNSRAPASIHELPINDRLFLIQSDTIKKLADEGSCILVGRCGNYVLRELPCAVHVFLYAPLPARIERVCRLYQLSESDAKNLIQKTDKKRANYYNYYSGAKWGQMENYQLFLDTSVIGVEKAAQLVIDFAALRVGQ